MTSTNIQPTQAPTPVLNTKAAAEQSHDTDSVRDFLRYMGGIDKKGTMSVEQYDAMLAKDAHRESARKLSV